MFRFGFIALGLFFFGFGAYLRWYVSPMSEVPAATTLEEVAELPAEGEHFVDFPGSLDLAAKRYRTGLAAPAWAACDPRVVHPLEGDWTALVGCTVALPGPAATAVATVTESRVDGALTPEEALRQRTILAPVSIGGDVTLWVLSPEFTHQAWSDDPPGSKYRIDMGRGPFPAMPHVTAEEETWLRNPAHVGPLGRFTDLPELRNDFASGAFAEGLAMAMGIDPRTTYVVLADGREPVARPARPSLPRVIAPVAGSTGVFVALDWDDEPTAERVTGVLSRIDDLGVIRRATPEAINRDRVGTANFSMGLGIVLVAFGGLLMLVVALLKQVGREMRRVRARR